MKRLPHEPSIAQMVSRDPEAYPVTSETINAARRAAQAERDKLNWLLLSDDHGPLAYVDGEGTMHIYPAIDVMM